MVVDFSITVIVYVLPSVVYFHIDTNGWMDDFLKTLIQCEKKKHTIQAHYEYVYNPHLQQVIEFIILQILLHYQV